jgi:hypothetical protein
VVHVALVALARQLAQVDSRGHLEWLADENR